MATRCAAARRVRGRDAHRLLIAHFASLRPRSVTSRLFLRCLPFAAIAIVAACAENLETSNNCPVLCVDQSLVFRDTTLDLITFDSALAGFTGEGERFPAPSLLTPVGLGFLAETFVPIANRTDSLDVRQVFRFDTLPSTLSATDSTRITAVTDSRLLLVLDTARSVIPAGDITVSLFDVDSTTSDDTTLTALTPLFRANRLIASRTFTRADIAADTISGSSTTNLRALTVSIPDSVMLNRILDRKRLRIGMQVSAASGVALRVLAPSVNQAGLVPRVSYDPSPDTAVRPWGVSTQYNGSASNGVRFRAQTLVVRDRTPLLNVTIVRASLDLTQRPLRTAPGAGEGVRVRARIAIAGGAFGGDTRRTAEVIDPLLEGALLPSLNVAPRDSGVRSFDIGSALRLWVAQDSTLPTSFVLFSEGENFQEQRPAFYSRRATNAAVRPKIRITYTTRRDGVIP
jgi:hypothetical protein